MPLYIGSDDSASSDDDTFSWPEVHNEFPRNPDSHTILLDHPTENYVEVTFKPKRPIQAFQVTFSTALALLFVIITILVAFWHMLLT